MCGLSHIFLFSFYLFVQWNFSTLLMHLLHKVPATFLDCFQVDTPLSSFFLSYWLPVFRIILIRLSHIFNSLSKWNHTTFFCVNVTQVLFKGIPIASKWNLSRNYSPLLCVSLIQGFNLFIWVIFDPFLFLCCVNFHPYFSSLCKWTLHLTVSASFSYLFSILHCLKRYLKRKHSFSFWFPVNEYFNFEQFKLYFHFNPF